MIRFLVINKKKIAISIAITIIFFTFLEIFARLGLKVYSLILYRNDNSVLEETNRRAAQIKGWEKGDERAFRGRDAPKEKRPGLFRIITTGDSCCWGALVPKEFTFSGRLEALLQERYGKERVEVLNAGRVMYNTAQVVEQIRNKLSDYHPDLIIYYGTGSDIVENGQTPKGAGALFERFLYSSKALMLFSQALFTPIKLPAHLQNIEQGPLIDEMEEAARQAGARLLLVEYLTMESKEIRSVLEGRENKFRVPVVRTFDKFVDSRLSPKKLMFDHVHPTPAGHKLIAQCINNQIINDGLIP